jgi:AcrR family transcriptional regulator
VSVESYRQTVKDAKRADILKSALKNFLKYGYTGAAMASIAEDADVSTATLYKNFASKEALFTAVATMAATTVQEDVGELPMDATAYDIFTKLIWAFHAAQQEHRVNDLIRVVIAEVPSSPDLTREIFQILVVGRQKKTRAYLDLMVERGLLKPHDTELGARFAMGMIKELAVWPTLFMPDYTFPPDILERAREVMDVYLARYGA